MAQNSGIQWTDATWNPVAGCSIVSPGCHNCYAAVMAARLEAMGQQKYAGTTKKVNGQVLWTGKINTDDAALSAPLKWRKPKRIFVNSMSDLFHEEVSDAYIEQVAQIMQLAHWHTYQVLTKRAERMAQLLATKLSFASTRGHIWWGVSVEDRNHGMPRIEFLRRAPAALRFLSIEPLLEDLGALDLAGIGWVIVGGESGPGARPMNLAWARSLRDQCKAAGVPYFLKQLGALPESEDDDAKCSKAGTKYALGVLLLKDKKGGDISEFPQDLRVREFPNV